jgi:putative transposase
MPKKSFSDFNRKAKLDVAAHQKEAVDIDRSPNDVLAEDATYTDLTAFPDKVVNEISYRLKVLRYLGKVCDKITTKTIEPHRVELPRLNDKKIPSAITIYRWWLNFSQSDYNPTCLAPDFKGRGNRESKVSKVVDALMEQAVEGAISGKKINISSAHRRVRRKVRQYNLKNGTKHKYPKYESLRKRFNKKTPYEVLAAKKGERVAKREFRRMGKKILTSYALERVEVDHTVLDLFVVHEEYRIPLGRPYLTQLVDCYSKAVVGFYLGFEPPSYVSVSLALKNAIQRKDSLLSSYPSVKNEWLCYGIPDLLVTDNGKEFLSKAFDAACETLLITVHQNKVETPDNKPNVERNYGTVNTTVLDDLPGKAFSHYLNREGYDSIGEATLTLDEIKEIYLIWLVDIYHKKPNQRGTNCPNVAWKRGCEEWEPEEFTGTTAELDFKFAILDKKKLSKSGITIYGLSYSNDRLAEYRGNHGNHIVTFKYNPECMGYIWVLDEDANEYFTVPAIDNEDASGVSLWQRKVNIKYQKEINSAEYDEDAEVDAEIRMQDVAEESIVKTKKVRNRRRGARYQENAERAKSQNQEILEKTEQGYPQEVDVDDENAWDIDYL